MSCYKGTFDMQNNKAKGVTLCIEGKKKRKRHIVGKGKVETEETKWSFRHEFHGQ